MTDLSYLRRNTPYEEPVIELHVRTPGWHGGCEQHLIETSKTVKQLRAELAARLYYPPHKTYIFVPSPNAIGWRMLTDLAQRVSECDVYSGIDVFVSPAADVGPGLLQQPPCGQHQRELTLPWMSEDRALRLQKIANSWESANYELRLKNIANLIDGGGRATRELSFRLPFQPHPMNQREAPIMTPAPSFGQLREQTLAWIDEVVLLEVLRESIPTTIQVTTVPALTDALKNAPLENGASGCIICFSALKQCINIPCGHLIACLSCTHEVNAKAKGGYMLCPTCRQPVSFVNLVFE